MPSDSRAVGYCARACARHFAAAAAHPGACAEASDVKTAAESPANSAIEMLAIFMLALPWACFIDHLVRQNSTVPGGSGIGSAGKTRQAWQFSFCSDPGSREPPQCPIPRIQSAAPTQGLSFCRAPPSPLREVRYPRSDRPGRRAVHNNRFANLIDSYRLATRQPPPAGHILVHNLPNSRAFRAWWMKPGTEFVLCECGWRAPISASTTASNDPVLMPNAFGDARAGPAS
jgi:hypothetical protein